DSESQSYTAQKKQKWQASTIELQKTTSNSARPTQASIKQNYTLAAQPSSSSQGNQINESFNNLSDDDDFFIKETTSKKTNN
ncbi:10763_t:CDS:2, partial [Gigaspora margarita]